MPYAPSPQDWGKYKRMEISVKEASKLLESEIAYKLKQGDEAATLELLKILEVLNSDKAETIRMAIKLLKGVR